MRRDDARTDRRLVWDQQTRWLPCPPLVGRDQPISHRSGRRLERVRGDLQRHRVRRVRLCLPAFVLDEELRGGQATQHARQVDGHALRHVVGRDGKRADPPRSLERGRIRRGDVVARAVDVERQHVDVEVASSGRCCGERVRDVERRSGVRVEQRRVV